MNRKLIVSLLSLLIAGTAFPQQKLTFEYAVKDTSHLMMDVYVPQQQNEEHSCMVFVFGGGFVSGARDDHQIKKLQQYYNDKGWVVIAIDYRLGLKGFKNFTLISGLEKFKNAIDMAGEDLISATGFILDSLQHRSDFQIDPNHIVTLGSSAGAITVLQADYFLGNRIHGTEFLPDTFRYAGVISFSGSILSRKGKVKYRIQPPAPTLLCHGTEDRLVPYKQIRVFNQGVFGSNALAKRFSKYDYPFHIRRYAGLAHEVAGIYPQEFNLIDNFIAEFVFGKKQIQSDETYYNPAIKRSEFGSYRIKDLKKL